MENGEVYFTGYIDTESSTFEINEVMADLCNAAVEENLYGDGGGGDDAYQNDDNGDDNDQTDDNGDDAYQKNDDANNGDDAYYVYSDDATSYNDDDANNGDDNNNSNNNNNNNSNECELVDGTYNFSAEFRIPQMKGNWGDTGWTATGRLMMYTYKGEQVGSCVASFTTQSHVGFSSKTVFYVLMPITGVVLFVLTYLSLRLVMRNIRDLRHGDLTYATFCDDNELT
jgi:hypothetical protein